LGTGCASQPARDTYAEVVTGPQYGIVGVATAQYDPVIDNRIRVRGKGSGAATGAGSGALGCIAGLAEEGGGYGLLVGVFIAPVCAIVGGVAGGVSATPKAELEVKESTLLGEINREKVQAPLRDKALGYLAEMNIAAVSVNHEAGPVSPGKQADYSAIGSQGPDTILEVAIEKVLVEGIGYGDIPINLTLVARSRLISAWGSKVLAEFEHSYQLDEFKLATLGGQNLARFSHELEAGYRRLAENAVDELLLIYRPTNTMLKNVPDPEHERWPVPYYALKPFYPRTEPQVRKIFSLKAQYFRVEESSPTFHWEAFPREWEREGIDGRLSDVTYELKLFSYTPGKKLDLSRPIYVRKGLTEPWHKLEIGLRHCGIYKWMVRAHFTLDGRPRMTEWGGVYTRGLIGHAAPGKFRRAVTSLHMLQSYLYTFRVHRGGRECK
jgi:hypothetical protein